MNEHQTDPTATDTDEDGLSDTLEFEESARAGNSLQYSLSPVVALGDLERAPFDTAVGSPFERDEFLGGFDEDGLAAGLGLVGSDDVLADDVALLNGVVLPRVADDLRWCGACQEPEVEPHDAGAEPATALTAEREDLSRVLDEVVLGVGVVRCPDRLAEFADGVDEAVVDSFAS